MLTNRVESPRVLVDGWLPLAQLGPYGKRYPCKSVGPRVESIRNIRTGWKIEMASAQMWSFHSTAEALPGPYRQAGPKGAGTARRRYWG